LSIAPFGGLGKKEQESTQVVLRSILLDDFNDFYNYSSAQSNQKIHNVRAHQSDGDFSLSQESRHFDFFSSYFY
jgi:hypothetical protein